MPRAVCRSARTHTHTAVAQQRSGSHFLRAAECTHTGGGAGHYDVCASRVGATRTHLHLVSRLVDGVEDRALHIRIGCDEYNPRVAVAQSSQHLPCVHPCLYLRDLNLKQSGAAGGLKLRDEAILTCSTHSAQQRSECH